MTTGAPVDRLFPLPGGQRRSPQVDQWFDSRPSVLASIARHWFDEMQSAGPDVLVLLHDGHPTACVGELAFAYVDAFKAHVNVGVFLGTSLPDPERLLRGSGRFMRHVSIRPGEAMNEDALRTLLRAAYSDMKARHT